ncbi:MAG: glycosyltransferase family 2 protein [Bacteroidota bacterium]
MSKLFKVSVIIPVYNAEKYLRKAVESAEILDEVGEIILIEDKSPDGALDLCKELASKYVKVKFYQHPDKGNHGAGASRNYGIKNASCDYIAFLDADDYYLTNRFFTDKEILESRKDAEGVYNCVGTYFHSEEAKNQFFNQGLGYQETLTFSAAPEPKDLFQVLFHQHNSITGEFHTNGITLRKPVFEKVGGRIFWSGKFELTLIGPSDEAWDIAFIAEYPNGQAFVDMVKDPVYREAVKHRTAAVKTSRLIRLEPQKSGSVFG